MARDEIHAKHWQTGSLMAQRDPLEGKLVVLIGGSGFFGAHLAQDLLARGARVRIAARNPERAGRIKPLGNLGQTQLVGCDAARPDTVRKAMIGADAAVYMVGAFNGDLDAIQDKAAGVAAAAAAEQGAQAFVYISAIGVDPDTDIPYARTKAEGEKSVLAAFPKATVLRPSVLFGEGDNFINMFARLIASLPVLPVFGPEARLQPLLVDDAALAVTTALADPARHGGRTYELAGPDVLTMGELNRRIAAAQGRRKLFIDMPDIGSAIFAAIPGSPMNLDQWRLLKQGNVASGTLPGIDKLGIRPRPLGLFLNRWMIRYRKHGRFAAPASA